MLNEYLKHNHLFCKFKAKKHQRLNSRLKQALITFMLDNKIKFLFRNYSNWKQFTLLLVSFLHCFNHMYMQNSKHTRLTASRQSYPSISFPFLFYIFMVDPSNLCIFRRFLSFRNLLRLEFCTNQNFKNFITLKECKKCKIFFL